MAWYLYVSGHGHQKFPILAKNAKNFMFTSFSGNPELLGNPTWVKKFHHTETNILVPYMSSYFNYMGILTK